MDELVKGEETKRRVVSKRGTERKSMEIRQKGGGRVNTSVSASERTRAKGVEESQVHLVRSGQILRRGVSEKERKVERDRQTETEKVVDRRRGTIR